MPKTSPERDRRQRRLKKRRIEYPHRVIKLWKESMRDRINKSFELVSFKAFRGDLHVHSIYSDGVGTVDEIKEYADSAGLDFFFVTDHEGVNQKRSCKKYPNVWWGQEPGTQYHHITILGIERKYTPRQDLVYDYNRAKALGGLAFIAHPAGWFPTTRYSDEQKASLDLLGDDFAIEIFNGANQIFQCFDVTDEMTLQIWDRHLCLGKRIRGYGATDAHLPQAMGDVWTGVFCEQLTRGAVLQALEKGHCFASDAPLAQIQLDGAMMGDVVRREPGEVAVEFECADSAGLASVRVIKDGKPIKDLQPDGGSKASGSISDQFGGGKSYYRLACFTVDNRRAYTNPIYVWEGE